MKKIFKIAIRIFIILLILFLLSILSLFIIMNSMQNSSKEKRYYDRGLSIIPECDYILVPGAKITLNLPSPDLQHRLDYAFMLYDAGKSNKIIVSGGFDEEVAKYEATVMQSYLVTLGVKEEDIIMDLKGNSTYETLKRTKEFVGDKTVTICTQELYSHRAVYIANNLGLNMNVFCSNPVIYVGRGKDTIRESLAQAKAILDCTLTPDTTNLEDSPFWMNEELKNKTSI